MKNSEKKILVIDDDESIAEVIEGFLEEEYGNITKAYNLRTSSDFLAKEQYSLITLDIGLNGENGGEILIMLKDINNLNHTTPVLVISGNLTTEFIERNEGRIRMLEKPFSGNELKKIVKEMIGELERDESTDSDEAENLETTDFLKGLTKNK